jgi:hypothetical protein
MTFSRHECAVQCHFRAGGDLTAWLATGAAVAWPLAARAQQGERVRRIRATEIGESTLACRAVLRLVGATRLSPWAHARQHGGRGSTLGAAGSRAVTSISAMLTKRAIASMRRSCSESNERILESDCLSIETAMRAPRTSEILEALVGFDTTSRNSNLPLVEWVEAYLDRFGVAHERITDASGTKANVWATIGPAGVPGTILSRTWSRSTDSHGRATRSG